MTSLMIMEFRAALENYIAEQDLPAEVKRMVLKDIYEDLAKLSKEDAMRELNEREAKKE